jgi:hypothetical protein
MPRSRDGSPRDPACSATADGVADLPTLATGLLRKADMPSDSGQSGEDAMRFAHGMGGVRTGLSRGRRLGSAPLDGVCVSLHGVDATVGAIRRRPTR